MRVDVFRRQGFPLHPAGAGNDAVVCVGDGEWSRAVAVVGCVPVLGSGCRFLGQADQNCCIEFCSSTKLWVTRPPITPRAFLYLLCLLQTRIMATGAVAILCFRCKQLAALLEADCSSSPALTPDIKWFFRQAA